ncbi:MAG: hydrogenase nickel incorporation protein HypB [Bifidobacteriaceae bacterium]|jgi:hydrogenase nickel incorporation protein HypB|nr:hydrogenase nickel incorporation protein HypB [Bifidobacteriaceae bacterium]
MGRFHRHDDGTVHEHGPDGHSHTHGDVPPAGHGSGHGHTHGDVPPAGHGSGHGDWDGHSHTHGDLPPAGDGSGHGDRDGHSHTHGDLPPAGDGIGHSHEGGPAAAGADARRKRDHSQDIGDHSGYETGLERIEILERIFDENDAAAAANRAVLDAAGVVAVNVMSSPGAGKTTLLAATLDALAGQVRCGVVEGDIETSLDADKLRGRGAQIALLNTGAGFGGECHLDAPMVAHALRELDLDSLDLVLIENVGNLVCPAEFDVGAHRKAMVFSVTEGEDKPLKYPVMFRAVDVVVLNKVDLLAYVPFDAAAFEANLRQINPDAALIETNALTGEGIQLWLRWLQAALVD